MAHSKLSAAALAFALCQSLACQNDEARADRPKPDEGPARVEVREAQAGNLSSSWRFLGQVQPALQAELASAVEGHVLQVEPREGDEVDKGDALVVLDSRKARASLAAARAKVSGSQAQLAMAERQYERVKDLGPPAVSEPEREGFQLAVASAAARLEGERAEVQRLEVEVAQHVLRAPFGGVVKAREVDPGAWVEPGTPMLELVALDQLELHVDVSAEIGTQLSVGQEAELFSPTGATAQARVEGIVSALDTSTRTMRVRLRPIDAPSWLLSGLAVDVAFEVELSGKGVLIPRDALLRGPVETRVLVIEQGKSRSLSVEVLASAGEQLLVRGDGLEVGAQVVVRGNERLGAGQAVEVAR
jgi:RND family efflux transporter MFP subunit